MEQKTNKIYVFLPWALTITMLGIVAIFSYNSKMHANLLETKHIKVNLLATMQIHLLEAIENEKNAVLAITDQESENFAARARLASESMESSRKEIEAVINLEKRPQEAEMMNEFNACWTKFRTLDETILHLATQNTNLKAQKLSATQCAFEMGNFEQSLNRLIHQQTIKKQCNQTTTLSYVALTAGLKTFVLHKPHIEEAEDEKMDKIELSIKSYDETARQALASLHQIADLKNNDDLKNAEAAYNRFMNLTTEVLRLSRLNTNIKSAELSLGKKSLISSQCKTILSNLQETVQKQQFNATR